MIAQTLLVLVWGVGALLLTPADAAAGGCGEVRYAGATSWSVPGPGCGRPAAGGIVAVAGGWLVWSCAGGLLSARPRADDPEGTGARTRAPFRVVIPPRGAGTLGVPKQPTAEAGEGVQELLKTGGTLVKGGQAVYTETVAITGPAYRPTPAPSGFAPELLIVTSVQIAIIAGRRFVVAFPRLSAAAVTAASRYFTATASVVPFS